MQLGDKRAAGSRGRACSMGRACSRRTSVQQGDERAAGHVRAVGTCVRQGGVCAGWDVRTAAPWCSARACAGNCAAAAPLTLRAPRDASAARAGLPRPDAAPGSGWGDAQHRPPCFRPATTALQGLPLLPPPQQQWQKGRAAALGLRLEAPPSAAISTPIKLPAPWAAALQRQGAESGRRGELRHLHPPPSARLSATLYPVSVIFSSYQSGVQMKSIMICTNA